MQERTHYEVRITLFCSNNDFTYLLGILQPVEWEEKVGSSQKTEMDADPSYHHHLLFIRLPYRSKPRVGIRLSAYREVLGGGIIFWKHFLTIPDSSPFPFIFVYPATVFWAGRERQEIQTKAEKKYSENSHFLWKITGALSTSGKKLNDFRMFDVEMSRGTEIEREDITRMISFSVLRGLEREEWNTFSFKRRETMRSE